MDLLEIALIKVYYMMLFLNQITQDMNKLQKREFPHITKKDKK